MATTLAPKTNKFRKNKNKNSTASSSFCWMAVFSGEKFLFSTVETGTKNLEFFFDGGGGGGL
jgi:hypothetical protein